MRNRLLALTGLSILLYLPSVFGGFMWDDEDIITGDHYVHSFSNAGRVLGPEYWKRDFPGAERRFRPARSLLLMAEWKAFGRSPAGYHAVNILLNAAAAGVAFWLAFLLLRDKDKALAAALFFALHPVHVESVAWIKNVTDILAFIFSGLAACLVLRGWQDRSRAAMAGAFLLFLLALGSKESSLVLPPLLLLWSVYLAGERPAAAIKRFWPFLAAGAVFAFFILYFLRRAPAGEAFSLKSSVLIFAQYSRLLFLPFDLNAERALVTAVDMAGPVMLLLAGWYLARSGSKAGVYGLLWAVVSILPFLDVRLVTGRPVAEQRLYGAVFGAGLAAAEIFWVPPLWRRAVLGLLLAVFAGFSLVRNFDWIDPVRFWERTVKSSPVSARARANLGLSYERAGRVQEAALEYEASAVLEPSRPESSLNMADLLYKLGRREDAAAVYGAILKALPDNRRASLGLMRLLLEGGDAAGAEKLGLKLLEADPGDHEALNSMGVVFMVTGRPAEAEAFFRKSLGINPEFADAMYNLAMLYHRSGRLPEAEAAYADLLRAAPGHAEGLNNLAILNDMAGREEMAIELFKTAETAAPGSYKASYNLGEVYYRRNMLIEALGQYTKVLGINPGHEKAARKAAEIRRKLEGNVQK